MIITPEPVLRAMQKRYFEWVAEPVKLEQNMYTSSHCLKMHMV